jgi:hypothetical protein
MLGRGDLLKSELLPFGTTIILTKGTGQGFGRFARRAAMVALVATKRIT